MSTTRPRSPIAPRGHRVRYRESPHRLWPVVVGAKRPSRAVRNPPVTHLSSPFVRFVLGMVERSPAVGTTWMRLKQTTFDGCF